MGEALARHLAADVIEASSAGLAPLGYVAAPTRAVLAESGVPTDGLASTPLRGADLAAVDLVVNMSGHPIENFLDGKALPVEDWDVGDPFGSDLEVYRRIRDEVERRVMDLAEHLRLPEKRTGAAR
jgi:arsenate reductase (thioredoxin)